MLELFSLLECLFAGFLKKTHTQPRNCGLTLDRDNSALSPGEAQPGHEDDHSHLSSAEVKKDCSHTSNPK
jgi:hypothetical protein